MSDLATWIAAILLSASALLSAARALRRCSLADRTLGLDLFVVVIATGVTVRAARTGVTWFLSLVTVVALLAFVATVTIARFLEVKKRVDPLFAETDTPATADSEEPR